MGVIFYPCSNHDLFPLVKSAPGAEVSFKDADISVLFRITVTS